MQAPQHVHSEALEAQSNIQSRAPNSSLSPVLLSQHPPRLTYVFPPSRTKHRLNGTMGPQAQPKLLHCKFQPVTQSKAGGIRWTRREILRPSERVLSGPRLEKEVPTSLTECSGWKGGTLEWHRDSISGLPAQAARQDHLWPEQRGYVRHLDRYWENALAPCHGWEEQAVHGPQDKHKEGKPKRPLWMHPLLGTVGKAQKRDTA